MRIGTYYFLQRPPGASDADVVRAEIAQMVACERLGFDSVWLTEHHFADYGISAAPSVLAAAVLSRTERLHVGLAVYVLPFHDPLRFAEETATLDILGGGRFIVGIGRGNRPTEFVGYRVPQAESRERLEEAMAVVLQAWTRPTVEHAGRHWRIPGIPVHPKPLTRPHPPVAVAATSADTVAWTAQHGFRLLSSGLTTPLASSLALRAQYAAALRDAGHDAATVARLLGAWALSKHVYVAPTDAEAQADARPAHAWYLDAFRRSMRADHLSDLPAAVYAQAEQFASNLARLRWDDLIEETLLVGSPETVIARMQQLQAAGVGELLCWTSFGGLSPAQVGRSLELLAREVLPVVRAAPAPAPAG
jgi:alkanesulfonate monooxygenase SsuD/methylene tetrahydromethanopterin reductase-like flavin-dependent oxidoreductase (luciferase family)